MQKLQIVYISSIPWSFSWHRQQEMMSELAERGVQVLFVQPCRKTRPLSADFSRQTENIWTLTPMGLPFERCLYGVHRINAWLSCSAIKSAMRCIGFRNPVIWMDRVHGFDWRCFAGCVKVYDLVDEILAFGRRRNGRMLIRLENDVLCAVDLLISSSQTLLTRKLSQSGRVGESLFIPNGVDTRRFSLTSAGHEGTIIGFIGHVAPRRINYKLIRAVARLHPEWRFEFVGPFTQEDAAELTEGLPNMYCCGQITGEQVPARIAGFDVGIIPYNHTDESMDYVFPRKVCEYLAAGKPVVSTRIPELQAGVGNGLLPMIHLEDTPEAFSAAIEDALKHSDADALRAYARRYDWDVFIPSLFDRLNTLRSRREKAEPNNKDT